MNKTPTDVGFVIGNTTKQVSNQSGSQWVWCVFVRDSPGNKTSVVSKYVSKVEFRLHPTFTPSTVQVLRPPFQIKRQGWGTFEVEVTVYTAFGNKHEFTHMLSFESSEVSKEYTLKLMDKPCQRYLAEQVPQKILTVSDTSQVNEVSEVAEEKTDVSDGRVPTVARTASAGYRTKDPHLAKVLEFMDKFISDNDPVSKWNGRRMTDVSRVVMHGNVANDSAAKDWVAPRCIVFCDQEARPGYTSRKAHEYQDEPCVLVEKVKVLAKLIKRSKNMCSYTGAGISTSSGIDDYASKSKNSVAMKRKKVSSGFDAQPTLAHRVMGGLYRAGHLKHWVQQNHDGLPQKAGFPPEHLNEIHGAWYDPSNPVVPMTGSLRNDLIEWLYEWEHKTDLCLAMGTSLCGMNADRMVETPGRKCMNTNLSKRSRGLGAVIIGLQQTQYDKIATLRIYAKLDEVMGLLAREMQLDVRPQQIYDCEIPKTKIKSKDVFVVPYNAQGKLEQDSTKWKRWDLRSGSYVKVTSGPGAGYVGQITGKNKEGHYRVRLPLQREGHEKQGKVWSTYIMGKWWLETAVNGKAAVLPIVNTKQGPTLAT